MMNINNEPNKKPNEEQNLRNLKVADSQSLKEFCILNEQDMKVLNDIFLKEASLREDFLNIKEKDEVKREAAVENLYKRLQAYNLSEDGWKKLGELTGIKDGTAYPKGAIFAVLISEDIANGYTTSFQANQYISAAFGTTAPYYDAIRSHDYRLKRENQNLEVETRAKFLRDTSIAAYDGKSRA